MTDVNLRELARCYAQTSSGEDRARLLRELERTGLGARQAADGLLAIRLTDLVDEGDVADCIAETNAVGFHLDDWEMVRCEPKSGTTWDIEARIHFSGEQLDDKPFISDELAGSIKGQIRWSPSAWEWIEEEEEVRVEVVREEFGDELHWESQINFEEQELVQTWIEGQTELVQAAEPGEKEPSGECVLCGQPIESDEDYFTAPTPVREDLSLKLDRTTFDGHFHCVLERVAENNDEGIDPSRFIEF